MSTAYQRIDYINTDFEYPTLDKIHGQPTYTTLTNLKKQVKSNAESVTSDLDGGCKRPFIGLVLTPAEYAEVSATPYQIPVHPGPFELQRNDDPAHAVLRRGRAPS